MRPVRTAVLVSGGGTNLQALLDAQERGELFPARITLVVSSNPEAYALTRAEKAGVKAEALDRPHTAAEEFEASLLRILSEEGTELIVLAGFLSILSEDFVKRFPRRILNVHPSLIPSFCGKGFYGLKVHEAALAKGVKVTGATVHYVNEIPDGGEILLQKAVEVLPDDTPETLQKRVMREAEWVLLPRAVKLAAERIAAEREEKA